MAQKEPEKKGNGKRVILFIAAVCLLTLAVCAAYGLIRKKGGDYLEEESTVAAGSKTSSETKSDAGGSQTDPEDKMPEFASFTAYDLELNEVNQDILKHYDLTMVNIWATFCGPCLREMPELGEIHDEYAEKGLQIVGIVTDILAADGSIDAGQLELTNEIIEKTGADYLHLVPTYDLYNLKLKDVSAVPETFFLDKDGNIVGNSYLGAKDKDAWLDIIDELLEEVQKE